ncbi:hypothetical protein SAMN02746089_01892 [Caldanaerobius fijiensis DSM 17918]|uniref:Uncharacterized protein n=1 Tax=Caldanaerobius fijiensis DSM 17918 TaxID=1121256 RepID=A0A1M5BKA8_9THEO|nr:PilN domain-containing protein [Caldanaerobius fijiensis]SHF42780.1 hypothetical protein SAMN02746089_01892 [Caldanaerobius fijiensis DSM 17918]
MAKKKLSAGFYISDSSIYMAFVKDDIVTKDKVPSEEFEKAEKMVRKFQDVVTCVSDPSIVYKNVMLPQELKRKEISEAVNLQFAELNNIQDYRVYHIMTDYTVENGINVICVAVPLKVINSFAERYRGRFTALDLSIFALWRGAVYNRKDTKKPVIITAQSNETIYMAAGRETIEFVREFSSDASADFERLRSIEYYRNAFNAEDAEVVELNEEESMYAMALGCALMPYDSASTNLLPQEYKRLRPTEMRKPKWYEVAIVVATLAASITAVPYVCAYRLDNLAKNYQANLIRAEMSSQQASRLQNEIRQYREQIDAVQSFRIQSYAEMVNNIRYALPQDCEIEKLEFKITSTQQTDIPQKFKLPKIQFGNQQNNQQSNPQNNPQSNQQSGQQEQGNQQNNAQNGNSDKQAQNTTISPSDSPDIISIEAKSKSIKSIGLFIDNLSRLPFIKNVSVGKTTYESSVYSFTITANISPM